MEHPRVKPHVALVLVARESLLVKGPALFVRYSGESAQAVHDVGRLLDGTRTLADVARATGLDPKDVADVVEALHADGVLEDAAQDAKLDPGTRARLDPQLQLFSHLSAHPAAMQQRVSGARVAVLGQGALRDAVARLVGASGATIETRDVDPLRPDGDEMHAWITRGEATHAVLALEGPYRHAFLAMDDAARRSGTRWTSVMLDGLEASVGPTIIPGQTACWRCYDLRALGAQPNLERLLAYEAHVGAPPRPLGLPAFVDAVGAWAAHAVVLTLAGGVAPPLANRVVRLSMLELTAQPHRVLRIPRCPACGAEGVPDVDRYALEPVA